ncbi:MAG: Tfp pilus assembly protein PilO [Candidatus Saccharimonadales bacterium]|jgi:Tfp pilus assembly protein PilO
MMDAKRTFYILLGVLSLSIGGIIGAYYWGDGQLKAKSAVISDLIADRDITQEKIIGLQQAAKESKDLDAVTQLLDNLLPREKQQEELVADVIYTATSEAGIPFSKITSFSFNGSSEPNTLSGTILSKENPGVYEYPFTLSIDGISYTTLLTLLSEIETNGRIVQVENIQISPDTSEIGLLTVSLSTKAYLKP